MTAFTLRLDDDLDKDLDKLCEEAGYSRTGLIKALLRQFLARQKQKKGLPVRPVPTNLNALVGIISLGNTNDTL